MKRRPPHRIAAILTLGCALVPGSAARAVRSAGSQDEPSATAILLSRARTLEQRGRLDLAKQDWSQVLLADPNDAEALGGLVRAARAEGRSGDADKYLARLRSAHPNDPALAQLQGGGKAQDTALLLDEAARLARGGDPRAAMVLYRKVYGNTPPVGAPALVYYGTEAATEEGRPHAIAGLRAMADRFPADARYRVELGRVLLSGARTRAEGRTILEGMPGNAEALAALRSSGSPAEEHASSSGAGGHLTVAASAPTMETKASSKSAEAPAQVAARHAEELNAAQRAQASAVSEKAAAEKTTPVRRPSEATPSVAVVHVPAAGGTRHLTYVADEQAAFSALNEHRTAQAEQLFQAILAKDPRDARALAGMGYLRVATGDLRAAVGFFEQAQEDGDHSLALTRAMVNAQFELALQQAGAERARGNLPAAEERFRAALRERPSDPEALEGLGSVLLQEWRPADAIPVYDHLTHVRPMSPAAWRGLVVAETSAGRTAAALTTDAQVPAAARTPLVGDQAYQRALSVAHGAQGTQVARVEPAPAIRPAPVVPPRPPVVLAAPVTPPPAGSSDRAAPRSETSERTAKTSPPENRKAVPPSGRGNRPSVPAPAPAAVAPPPVAVPARPPVPARPAPASPELVQQADLALLHGSNAAAATMFRSVVARGPERAEGWRGLVLALHNEGHEAEALVALEQVPTGAKLVLDRDASFQAAAGGVYLAMNQPNEALRSFARAQDVFSGQRLPPPLELVLETARLLAARGDDENLYRELMYLGERMDLNDTRRTEVQMIWTRWAVRRARALAAAGDDQRAVTLLNAAAGAFTGNAEVLRLVADGYAGIGKPREAVALYKTQDLGTAPAAAVEAAVHSAAAAHDFKTAEGWMHVGLQRFPADPQMVNTAAELAQTRGREKRAIALAQQAKGLAPAQNPGQVLAAELKEANAGQGWPGQRNSTGQLGVLLAPGDAVAAAGAAKQRPYLPATAERTPVGAAPSVAVEPPVLMGYDEPSR